MNNPLFIMNNNHSSSDENRLVFTNDNPNQYCGYFENEHGEQWVFLYDRKTGISELRGGDVGWENIYQVIDGHVIELILSAEEKMWLKACWNAATAFRRR